MSPAQPTVVVVPGAWHVPAHYQALVDPLTKAGFKPHIVALPTCNGARPPTANFEDDVAAVEAVLEQLASTGDRIVLLMHSYGGTVGSSAVAPSLISKGPGQPGVVSLVYLAAGLIDAGVSFVDIRAKVDLPPSKGQIVVHSDGANVVTNAHEFLYADISAEDAALYDALLVPHALQPRIQPPKRAPWKTLPATYVYATDDLAIPYPLQKVFVSEARKVGPKDLREETLVSSHSPFLSRTGDVVEIVKKVWAVDGSS